MNRAMDKIITWEGTESHIQPSNGTDYSLKELVAIVNGYIEIVRLGNGQLMVCNEEGKLNRLDYNPLATALAHSRQAIASSDYIVGNVLVCDEKEVK